LGGESSLGKAFKKKKRVKAFEGEGICEETFEKAATLKRRGSVGESLRKRQADQEEGQPSREGCWLPTRAGRERRVSRMRRLFRVCQGRKESSQSTVLSGERALNEEHMPALLRERPDLSGFRKKMSGKGDPQEGGVGQAKKKSSR